MKFFSKNSINKLFLYENKKNAQNDQKWTFFFYKSALAHYQRAMKRTNLRAFVGPFKDFKSPNTNFIAIHIFELEARSKRKKVSKMTKNG